MREVILQKETGEKVPPTVRTELPDINLLLRERNRLELHNEILYRMVADIEARIKTYNRCVRRKTLPEKAAALVNIKFTRLLELVCMDFLSIEPDQSNTKDVLVLTDHLSKYAVAIPTTNQKAQTVAERLWDNFIVHYGFPERLLTDQGPDF